MSQERRWTHLHIPEHLGLSKDGDKNKFGEVWNDGRTCGSSELISQPEASSLVPDAPCTRAVATPKKNKVPRTNPPPQLRHSLVNANGHILHILSPIPKS